MDWATFFFLAGNIPTRQKRAVWSFWPVQVHPLLRLSNNSECKQTNLCFLIKKLKKSVRNLAFKGEKSGVYLNKKIKLKKIQKDYKLRGGRMNNQIHKDSVPSQLTTRSYASFLGFLWQCNLSIFCLFHFISSMSFN